ncbi:DNA ligase D [Polaromonas sp.]|uniref:DNA ligase D n=1 Tax=Polaromonas sp. TaxID=1869339 RepID=UPI00286D19EC|nr:DNA ligase D [Polaromonas sp.]
MPSRDPLEGYRAKRDFSRTPEPADLAAPSGATPGFVVQKHAARSPHYDFRLELQGTLKSWAIPKGPSLDPAVKRMGVQVEDHPLAYATFEGRIPPKQYGAGEVIVWDRGFWTPVGDPVQGLAQGKLKFALHGEKLQGGWTLVRMHGSADHAPEKHEPWLLIKEKDEFARPANEFDVLKALPDSVLGGPARQDSGGIPQGAVAAPLPPALAPQLATLANQAPDTAQGWVYEIKFDGYRLLTRIEASSVRCFTRNRHDWTAKMPALAKAIAQLGIDAGWLDGEIVLLNDQGLPDFGALQNAFDGAGTARLVYYVFDLPFYDGLDLRPLPLTQRRDMLLAALTRNPQDNIRFSEAFEQSPQDLLAAARQLGLEGVIGKRRQAPYSSGRSTDWIKLKTGLRQAFVIGGYTAPKGSRTGLGALLLGLHDARGKLRYAGNVGTGFSDKTLQALSTRLARLHTARSPFADLAGRPAGVQGQWVKPRLLAEVAFADWTGSGRIRHGVFQGLRADKPPTAIVRETVAPPQAAAASPGSAALKSLRSLRITHGDRVIDKTSGFTKQQGVEHYAAVAALMLPHLKARPVSLVRAPSGITGQLFFQKHAEASSIPGIRLLDPALDPGHAPLLEIPSVAALLAAAQVNVIEFHTWNATDRAIRHPDRMTFDLDPGEGVGWAQVQEAALLVKTMLDELDLASFLKTSGGKGLHVVVPLRPSSAHDFDTVKDFSHALVTHLARIVPQRFVAKSGPKNRIDKIFVDYLRNGFGATTVSAWSLRARPGLGVSVPVAWDELASLTGGAHWTARSVAARLAIGNTPWSGYASSRNRLSAAMKQLGFKAPASRR